MLREGLYSLRRILHGYDMNSPAKGIFLVREGFPAPSNKHLIEF